MLLCKWYGPLHLILMEPNKATEKLVVGLGPGGNIDPISNCTLINFVIIAHNLCIGISCRPIPMNPRVASPSHLPAPT